MKRISAPVKVTIIAIVLLVNVHGVTRAASYEEHLLKAAFLYNFADFIFWPYPDRSRTNSALTYCVIGEGLVPNAVASLLSSSDSAQIERNFQAISSQSQVDLCDLLFLDSENTLSVTDWLAATNGKAILTVSDTERFLEAGGMIELARQESRVEVKLNEDQLNAQEFRVSSQLMRLATIYSTPREGK